MSEPKYEQHLTTFVDLLGFSETSFSEPKKTNALLQMLQRLSHLQSEAGIDWLRKKGGSAVVIRPAISSFSDNIVISFPISQVSDYVEDDNDLALSVLLPSLRTTIGYIAAEAFTLGYLIRGGIALGGLFHSSGVVFGEALIEAYRVERKVSVNPRIVLSPTVIRFPGFAGLDPRLFRQDIDHEYCFEYIFPMIMSLGASKIDGMSRWYIENIEFVDEQIRTLLQRSKNKEAAKWGWFKNEISKSLTRHGAGQALKRGQTGEA